MTHHQAVDDGYDDDEPEGTPQIPVELAALVAMPAAALLVGAVVVFLT